MNTLTWLPSPSVGIAKSKCKQRLASELVVAIPTSLGLDLPSLPGFNIYNEYNQFAGSELERAADFQSMMDNESVKAIICTRGGYGSIKLIPHLNFEKFIKSSISKLNDTINFKDIDEVILVGGSTRIPAIQEAVKAFFNK